MAQSGHPATLNQCPLSGVKRTFFQLAAMSVIDPKRTCRAERADRPKASLALHRDHEAARRRMPLCDQRPVAGIVVPILDGLLARKFDNDDAARPLTFEHFMRAGFGEITSTVLFDKRRCLLEVVAKAASSSISCWPM